MVIKKYIAKTEEAATALAREELGKDVVIMNVKKNIPKGIAKFFRKESVEVTAAVDELVTDSESKHMPDFSKLQEDIKGEKTGTGFQSSKGRGGKGCFGREESGDFGGGAGRRDSIRKQRH